MSKIMTQKDIKAELPDPKYHKSAQFYDKNRIPFKQKTNFTDDRVAQLDESFKGKEKFLGDSMLISDNTKVKNKSLAKILKHNQTLQGNNFFIFRK